MINQWENAAESFTIGQENSEYAEVNKKVVKQRFQQLNGKKVLDLGCGYGYYTDYFDSIGANTVGMDGAQMMISIARKKFPDSRFIIADLYDSFPFDDKSFDIVFCNQVLMDIEKIDSVLCECNRVLKDKGILYYSIIHPDFYNGEWQTDDKGFKYAKAISCYRTSYVSTNHFWGETYHFHRTLSEYLNTAAKAGFSLVHADEPESYDGLHTTKELPLFFFAEYEKRNTV